ncbi:MAG: protein serine/threonine phosphatase [Bacteroidota bacterium]|nr:protein serine/threonine phosphatase [Bacteroidota bacterium]
MNDQPGLAASYNNLGRLNYKMGNYNESLKNNMECLKLYEALEDEEGMALSYFNLGDVYFVQKKYKEAEQSFMQAKRLSLKVNYRLNLKFIYQSLAELYKNRKDFKKAFENQAMFILYNDSISNEETKKQTIQMQMTYDFEKKEAVADAEHKKEIENQKVLAHEKNRKQTIIIAVTIIVLLLVMIFAAFIFRSLRTTRKQKAVIESQKSEVEHQKHLVEEKQKEIIDSITYAKRLQKAILPSDEDLRKHLPDSFVLYQPKDIVAGDFYWMHVSNDLVFIAAADSTGHGVPGAMVSVVCSNALNRAVDEFQLSDTGQILDKTRDLVLETFAKSGEEIKDGMDISLLCINKVANVISWSGANNQLWYIQNETFKEIKANKQAIGKTDEPKPFTTHKIEVNTGDTFYLMTDGYPDQFGGPKGKKYKYKSLEEKLISISHLTLTEQQEILTSVFNNWKGDLEQVDDVTIIGIKI